MASGRRVSPQSIMRDVIDAVSDGDYLFIQKRIRAKQKTPGSWYNPHRN